MADRMTLRNMVFYAHHGVFEAEKEMGQRFEIDVSLDLDLAAAGRSDDLALSVNYADVYALVKRVVVERNFNLIEGLAEAIASQLLAAYSGVERATVRVRKPHAPVGGVLDTVEVEISRPGGGSTP